MVYNGRRFVENAVELEREIILAMFICSSTHRSGQAPGGSSQISFGPGGLGTPQRAHGDNIDAARKESIKEQILKPQPDARGGGTPFRNGMMTPPLTSSKRDQVWEKKRRQWEARRGGSRDPYNDQVYQQQQPSNGPPPIQINTNTDSNLHQPRASPSSPLSQFVNNVDQRSHLRSGGGAQQEYNRQGYDPQNPPYPQPQANLHANAGYGGQYGQPAIVPALSQPPPGQQDDMIFRQASAQLSARARSRERLGPQVGESMYSNPNDYNQYPGQTQPQGFSNSQSQYGGCSEPPSQGNYSNHSNQYAQPSNAGYTSNSYGRCAWMKFGIRGLM